MNVFELIKNSITFEEVTKDHGIEFDSGGKALCPFHDEKTPSFHNYDRHGYCFGCRKFADIIDIETHFSGLPPFEAALSLAKRYGIHLPEFSTDSRGKLEERRLVEKILTEAALYYRSILRENPRLMEYLTNERGINESTIEHFKIGWAPLDAQVDRYLIGKGFKLEDILKTGLLLKTIQGVTEFFQGRIVFPFWRDGICNYMIGRRFEGETASTPSEAAKYKKLPLWSENRPYVSKTLSNDYFYNEDALRRAKPIIITEGIVDCIVIHQTGFDCISPAATRVNEGALLRLEKLTKNVPLIYICYDNEKNKRGEEGALATAETLEDMGKNVQIITIPRAPEVDKVDAADFLRARIPNEREAFEGLLKSSMSLTEYQLVQVPEEVKKIELIPSLRPIMRRLAVRQAGPMELDLTFELIKDRFQINKGTLREEFEEIRRQVEAERERQKPQNKKEEMLENLKLLHPSFDITPGVLTLGFRVHVRVGSRIDEREIFLVSDGTTVQKVEELQFELNGMTYYIEKPKSPLMRLDDVWSTKKLNDFLGTPASPPKGIYNKIKEILKKYLDFQSESDYGLVGAWIIATWFYLGYRAFPFLLFYGGKGSGKSQALEVLKFLCLNANKIKGLSVASMCDTIDGLRGVMCLDQAEMLGSSHNNQEIVGIIADSYKREGGKRRIVLHDKSLRKVLEFSSYGPKAFGSKKNIDPDILDRCASIPMVRTDKSYPEPEPWSEDWLAIRDMLYRLLLTRWKEFLDISREAKKFTGRVSELWRPIYTVLLFDDVPQGEVKEIEQRFLKLMVRTQQAEIGEWEGALFEVLNDFCEGEYIGHLYGGEFKGKLKESDDEIKLLGTTLCSQVRAVLPESDKYPTPQWLGQVLGKYDLIEDKDRRRIDGKLETIYLFQKKRVLSILKKLRTQEQGEEKSNHYGGLEVFSDEKGIKEQSRTQEHEHDPVPCSHSLSRDGGENKPENNQNG